MIDLIGYRRLGHNEADEPAYTQPRMYELIKKHPPVRKVYADAARSRRGSSPAEEPDRMLEAAKQRLAEAHEDVKHAGGAAHRRAAARPHPERGAGHGGSRSTSCSTLNRQLFAAPEGFNVHRKLAPQRAKRAEVGADDPVDWGQAEALAFAHAAACRGRPLRLTGQDTARGTFSQRHLVLLDAKTGSGTRRSSTSSRRRRPSRSTTARCRRRQRSASSTATASRRPRRS